MLLGVTLKVLSALVFSAMSALVKYTSGTYPVGELVFFRSLFALPVLIAWLASRGEFPRAISTQRMLGHIGRGIAGTCGMFSSFIALRLLPLPDATAFGFAAPLMVVALAALVLGERVRVYRWTAVAVGFLGVVVMLSEHLAEAHNGARPTSLGPIVALSAALFSAIATIQTRRLTLSEPTGAIVFYFSLTTTVGGLLTCVVPLIWPVGGPAAAFIAQQAWIAPSRGDAMLLILIGAFGGMGQILMTQSYRYADASVVAPFDYTSMLWAALLGLFVFGEVPSGLVLFGAGIIAAAGLFVIWREKRLGLLRAEPRRAGVIRPL